MNKTGIALFTYNRPEHTGQVLQGLMRNDIDKLYVFSDGYRDERDRITVQQVRKLLANITWCETEIIESDTNKGLADSIVYGVNYVLDRHERIIVLEDDCVPSADFVSFMQKCFDKYEYNEQIMNVAGYSLPIKIPQSYPYDIYFSYRPSSWGWGTWRRAWHHFSRDKAILDEIRNSKELHKKVNQAGEDLVPMLERQIRGAIDSWAVFFALSIIKNDGLCVVPVHSRIKNIGHDASGTHCGANQKYNVELYKETIGNLVLPDEVVIDDQIIHRIRQFCSPTMSEKVINFIVQVLQPAGIYELFRWTRRHFKA
ncbi:MAG: glycosyltransferase [Dehalococcoidales bacterium]|nr:glycosyltransferase [Dehalococcoidales bacterium]